MASFEMRWCALSTAASTVDASSSMCCFYATLSKTFAIIFWLTIDSPMAYTCLWLSISISYCNESTAISYISSLMLSWNRLSHILFNIILFWILIYSRLYFSYSFFYWTAYLASEIVSSATSKHMSSMRSARIWFRYLTTSFFILAFTYVLYPISVVWLSIISLSIWDIAYSVTSLFYYC